MQEKPATGSMMVSYVWGLFQMGALVRNPSILTPRVARPTARPP